jgi:hypothetical protein
MDSLGQDAIAILQYLLPGFLAAWVFYGFTAYPTPSQFERVVQALIFTLFIQGIVYLEREWIFDDGALVESWDPGTQLLAATLTAIGVGVIASYCANKNVVHRWAYRLGVTKETSYPSEWYDAFREPCYVVLHLKDQRRLYGWPRVWPTDPKEGHFVIENPSWLTKTGEIPLTGLSSILMAVQDIKWVEFVKAP